MVGGPFGSKLVSSDYVDAGVPVIRGVNLPADSRFSFDDLVFVSEEKVARDLFGNLATPGDIVVTQRGTLGQVGIIPSDCPYETLVVSQSQMKLTVDPAIADVQYIYYALISPHGQHEIRSGAITAGVPHINLSLFQDLRIPLPPLLAQRKIAAILSAYDDLIENSNRRIKALEDMAQRIYREWFVEFRYPGHEAVRLVASDVGPIPDGWRVVRLREVATVTKGLSYQGAYLTESGLPMANLKCLKPAGGFRRDGTKAYSGPFKDRHRIAPGDLIVANTDLTQAGNVIGSPALVPKRGFEQGGLISHHLFAVRPNPAVLAAPFLYHVLKDERARSFARALASGTTVLGLRTSDYEGYQVVLPSDDLLMRFSAFAECAQSLGDCLEDAVEGAGTTRNLLLPVLISGEVNMEDLSIAVEEPAA